MGNLDWQEMGTLLGAQPAAYRGGKWDAYDDAGKPRTGLTGYRRIRFDRLACGVHPSGIGLVNQEVQEGGCGTCAHRIKVYRGEEPRLQYKCRFLPVTHDKGRSTDVLAAWPACQRYEPAPPPPEKKDKRKSRS
jgi:hypothetical protein